MAALLILWYFVRASHRRTAFWMLTQTERSLWERSFSRYATCPALKKSLVLPNRNVSWSLEQNSQARTGGHLAKASLFFFVPSCNFKNLSVEFLRTLMSLSVRFLQVCTLSGSRSVCRTRTR